MSDIAIRTEGRAGLITLQRPKALNAVTYDMCTAIEEAIENWRHDETVELVLIDAEGERAFCAGGDIAELYKTGTEGDYSYGRTFWADEYRLNAKLSAYAKPVVSFLQGFTMGGGVGIGCHGSHRIVGESSQISMPECGIGLVPDVGGSLILAKAPGRLGEYLGTTAARMNAADAIHAGFADHFIPEENWPAVKAALINGDDIGSVIDSWSKPTEPGPIQRAQGQIDRLFAGESLTDILADLRKDSSDFAAKTLKGLSRNSPLSMACTIELVHRLRGPSSSIEQALDLEYRFTYRAMEDGDFLEGIRAQIIDKDRDPHWQFADLNVPVAAISRMLAPLGDNALTL